MQTKPEVREDGILQFLRVVHENGLRLGGNVPNEEKRVEPEERETVPLTQIEAARLARLSRPSIAKYANHVRTVLDEGSLSIRKKTGYALGVDFGATHATRIALSDVNGWVMEVRPDEEEKGALEPQSPRQALECAEREINALLEKYKIDASEIVGVGIGLPGPVKDDRLIGRDAKLWQHFDPVGELRSRLGWEEVPFRAQSDTYLSALAERMWSAESVADTFLYVKWSAGLRAAIVIDGEFYTGHSGTAGELPHIVIDRGRSERCTVCGQEGCLHAIASLETISARIAARDGRDYEPLRAASIVERARDSRETLKELELAAQGIGQAIAPMVDALDPEVVVIAGALGSRAYPLVLEALTVGLANHSLRDGVPVRRGRLIRRTATVGAIALVLRDFAPEYLRRVAELEVVH